MTEQERQEWLNELSNIHCSENLDESAIGLWKSMIPDIVKIRYDRLYVQFDDKTRFFFIVFYIGILTIEATTYDDEDDDYVYYSIVGHVDDKKHVITTNILSRPLFFSMMNDSWGKHNDMLKEDNGSTQAI